MTNSESPALKWKFDHRGRWHAVSQIMDPEMTDEDSDIWCREWCLNWDIYVDESGYFCIDESDKLLFRECEVTRACGEPVSDGMLLRAYNRNLGEVQEMIELIEQHLRTQETFNDGSKIVLLEKEVYCR